MHLKQIKYFVALCEELNFTRAALRCGISQPSLTGSIKRLEVELGGELFVRKPNVSVTCLGETVRPYLERIASEADAALNLARSLGKRARRHTAIGARGRLVSQEAYK
jgi:LysR family hydrogen peroxide-inducible transcriptional activator